jgi:hypothetical protein
VYQLKPHGLSGFVVTPKSIKEYVALLNDHIQAFNADIANSDCLDAQFLTPWSAFLNRWTTWALGVSWLDRLWLSTQETAEQFAVEFNTFRKEFTTLCDRTPSGGDVPIPGADQQEQLMSFGKSLVWTAGGVLAIYTTFKILQSSPRRRRTA